uniref:HAT C-terminal dimerisation domain-containing protein n=1 Tax=Magallana gigas TaxID=29159 RepID=A0A8W8NVZ1_MAGGI
MLRTHVKETIDLLHQLVENYQRKQLQDTEYQKCGDLFLEESINRLVEFYGTAKGDTFQGHRVQVRAQFDPVALRTELENFKRHLYMLRRRGCTTIQSIYKEFVLSGYCLERLFPLIYHLYYLALIIPSSTALVERGFSLMSNIVTTKRNRLTEQNTDASVKM